MKFSRSIAAIALAALRSPDNAVAIRQAGLAAAKPAPLQ